MIQQIRMNPKMELMTIPAITPPLISFPSSYIGWATIVTVTVSSRGRTVVASWGIVEVGKAGILLEDLFSFIFFPCLFVLFVSLLLFKKRI